MGPWTTWSQVKALSVGVCTILEQDNFILPGLSGIQPKVYASQICLKVKVLPPSPVFINFVDIQVPTIMLLQSNTHLEKGIATDLLLPCLLKRYNSWYLHTNHKDQGHHKPLKNTKFKLFFAGIINTSTLFVLNIYISFFSIFNGGS